MNNASLQQHIAMQPHVYSIHTVGMVFLTSHQNYAMMVIRTPTIAVPYNVIWLEQLEVVKLNQIVHVQRSRLQQTIDLYHSYEEEVSIQEETMTISVLALILGLVSLYKRTATGLHSRVVQIQQPKILCC